MGRYNDDQMDQLIKQSLGKKEQIDEAIKEEVKDQIYELYMKEKAKEREHTRWTEKAVGSVLIAMSTLSCLIILCLLVVASMSSFLIILGIGIFATTGYFYWNMRSKIKGLYRGSEC